MPLLAIAPPMPLNELRSRSELIARVRVLDVTHLGSVEEYGTSLGIYRARLQLLRVMKGRETPGSVVGVTWKDVPPRLPGPWALAYSQGEEVTTHLRRDPVSGDYVSTWWNAKTAGRGGGWRERLRALLPWRKSAPPTEPSLSGPEPTEAKLPDCVCLERGPGLVNRAFGSGERAVGTDTTNGRYADVTVRRCLRCGRLWLRYQVEYEYMSRSGRWAEGVVDAETAARVTAEQAPGVLAELPWRIHGGSFFGHGGRKGSGPVPWDVVIEGPE